MEGIEGDGGNDYADVSLEFDTMLDASFGKSKKRKLKNRFGLNQVDNRHGILWNRQTIHNKTHVLTIYLFICCCCLEI